MKRTSRFSASVRPSGGRCSFRPQLEMMEARLQPGSILTATMSGTLLMQSLVIWDSGLPASEDALSTMMPETEQVACHYTSLPADREGTYATTESGGVNGMIVQTQTHSQSPGTQTARESTGYRPPTKCDGGTWYTLQSMPSKRQELSTAVLNGEVYAIAGYDSFGNSTTTVEVYNPDTDSWRNAAALPIANNHNAAAVAGGTLYVFGGLSESVFAYNPDKDSWSPVASMHYRHGNTPAVAVIDGKIYVAGGNGPGMMQKEVEVYDPSADSWSILAPMNVPRNHTAGGAIDGQFYVAGGRDSPNAANALEVYDPQTNIWTVLSPMPTGRSGLASGVVNGCLYTFGGELPQLFDNVEVYHPATDTWQELAPMPTPRHGIFGAVIGNAIYLPGGATQQGYGAADVNEVYVVG